MRPATIPGMKKDRVKFGGVLFYRCASGYYYSFNGPERALHRLVWEHHNGPIPPDHHIHHRDRNPSNNDITNLECMLGSEHHRMHFREFAVPGFDDEAQKKARVWHSSPEGREWHRQHAIRVAEGLPSVVMTCAVCGDEFPAKQPNRARFCSKRCKQQALRDRRKAEHGQQAQGRDDR